MRPDRDSLSPAERRQAVAAVLAVGLLRLGQLPVTAAIPALVTSENLSESGRDCLELPAKTRLSVQNG
jgi:hypothetical protein